MFEKLLHLRLTNFFDKNNIINNNQFGFRKNYSAEDAIIKSISTIQNAIKRKNKCAAVYIDLKKAFETVPHQILLNKLDKCGVRGHANELIKNLVIDRHQLTDYNGIKSDETTSKTGVPQGSVLGPLLFLIFINDIFKINDNKDINIILYADDMIIICEGLTDKDVQNKLNNINVSLTKWLKDNIMNINAGKTEYMIFSISGNTTTDYKIKIDGNIINKTSSNNYLGIDIDNCLKFNKHIDNVIKKITPIIAIMNRIKYVCNNYILKTIYNGLIYPHLLYGIVAWGSAYDTHLNKLKILQKKAIRVLTGSKWNDHTDPLFQSEKILKLNNIYKYKLAIIMHKIKNNNDIYNLDLKHYNDIVTRITRSVDAKVYYENMYTTEFGKKSISSMGVKQYNDIPYNIKNTYSSKIFGRNVKQWLMNDI